MITLVSFRTIYLSELLVEYIAVFSLKFCVLRHFVQYIVEDECVGVEKRELPITIREAVQTANPSTWDAFLPRTSGNKGLWLLQNSGQRMAGPYAGKWLPLPCAVCAKSTTKCLLFKENLFDYNGTSGQSIATVHYTPYKLSSMDMCPSCKTSMGEKVQELKLDFAGAEGTEQLPVGDVVLKRSRAAEVELT
ncbi:hypothetical protein B0H11DRAFT_1901516 [Mycena galericulata]|nr:hypothetical protein B0H11DRAFT_1901516 [Mycena galericulata]